MKNPSFSIWSGWLGATLIACISLSAGAFTTFQTKEEAKETKSDIVKSLDEIKSEMHEIHKELREQ